jgi:divalent metal cation (Fe/Co/Zn/Cd) transporter
VFYEDTAGILGVLLATAGVAAHQITGSAVPDAMASFAIGLLLITVALRLAQRDRELLTNQSASPVIVDGVRRLMETEPGVAGIPRLAVLIVGPRTWLVTADVAVDGTVPGGDVTRLVNRLRGRLRSEPGITEAYLTPVPHSVAAPHLVPAPQPLET